MVKLNEGTDTALETADVALIDDNLWMAVFADMGASLIVVANGLRLLRFR